MCGKVLSMLNWHRRLDTRNPRFKRTCRGRGRRKKIQINDDESCVTDQEASVNIGHEALSSTAENPVVKVKDGGAD